jgi:hypothetical protein
MRPYLKRHHLVCCSRVSLSAKCKSTGTSTPRTLVSLCLAPCPLPAALMPSNMCPPKHTLGFCFVNPHLCPPVIMYPCLDYVRVILCTGKRRKGANTPFHPFLGLRLTAPPPPPVHAFLHAQKKVSVSTPPLALTVLVNSFVLKHSEFT